MRAFLLFSAFVLGIPTFAQSAADQAGKDLVNFGIVSWDHSGSAILYRGGRPDVNGIADLKNLGVHTVVSLQGGDVETEIHINGLPDAISSVLNRALNYVVAIWEPGEMPASISNEQNQAVQAGMAFESHPLSSIEPVSTDEAEQIKQILRTMHDPSRQPVYVHCQHGRDRTGMIVALYRVCYENANPENAYQEMLALGHNPNDHVTEAGDIFFWRSVSTGFCKTL